jgi:hypothetical protein
VNESAAKNVEGDHKFNEQKSDLFEAPPPSSLDKINLLTKKQ